MLMYEALGLCEEGKGGELIDNAKWIQNANGILFIHLSDRNSSFESSQETIDTIMEINLC